MHLTMYSISSKWYSAISSRYCRTVALFYPYTVPSIGGHVGKMWKSRCLQITTSLSSSLPMVKTDRSCSLRSSGSHAFPWPARTESLSAVYKNKAKPRNLLYFEKSCSQTNSNNNECYRNNVQYTEMAPNVLEWQNKPRVFILWIVITAAVAKSTYRMFFWK